MSFKQMLDDRRSNAVSIFHKFRTSTNPDGCIHVFMEGYDDSIFYGKIMSSFALEQEAIWKSHITLGKKNMDKVIQLYQSARNEKRKVLFIRDSDFDRFLGLAPTGEDIFLTCGYSVENYVCGRASLVAFVTSVFGVDKDEVALDSLLDKHFQTVEKLFKWLSGFFGAAFEAAHSNQTLDLDKLDIIDFYQSLANGGVLAAEVPNEKVTACKLDHAHFKNESKIRGTAYTAQNYLWWMRGKYLILCTCEFLKICEKEFRAKYKKKEISRFNRKTNSDFSAASVFERLSGFTQPTAELNNAFSKKLDH